MNTLPTEEHTIVLRQKFLPHWEVRQRDSALRSDCSIIQGGREALTHKAFSMPHLSSV
jgi:hypothetical protein